MTLLISVEDLWNSKPCAMRETKKPQMADMEFVEALEYAMPPAFGFGLSERLFSFLMDKPVRETQLFPLLKPEKIKKYERTQRI